MSEFGSQLNIICLESEAFYALVKDVVDRMKEESDISHDKWISDTEAMKLLRITSRTTLQKMRDDSKRASFDLNSKPALIIFPRLGLMRLYGIYRFSETVSFD